MCQFGWRNASSEAPAASGLGQQTMIVSHGVVPDETDFGRIESWSENQKLKPWFYDLLHTKFEWLYSLPNNIITVLYHIVHCFLLQLYFKVQLSEKSAPGKLHVMLLFCSARKHPNYTRLGVRFIFFFQTHLAPLIISHVPREHDHCGSHKFAKISLSSREKPPIWGRKKASSLEKLVSNQPIGRHKSRWI